jgi:signal transduction histidine kinase
MPKNAPQHRNLHAEMEETAKLRTLNSFAIDLISIPNVEDLFWYVARNVVGRIKFLDCVIYQANETQTELVQVAALGEKNPYGRSILNPLKIPFGQGITGQVAQSRAAIVVDDLLTDQNYIADTQRARSEICVPIICGNRVVGVIDSEHPSPGAFGTAEMEVLITIAAMTGAKLDLLEEAKRSNERYHDLVTAHAQLSLETKNRKTLEAELFNARKLEAVGRLTGRFAHEFNNLLTVVSGNLEFLDAVIDDASAVDTLRDAQNAASRGADLIKSMLAYSQRTTLSPSLINLNDVVAKTAHEHADDKTNALVMSFGKDIGYVNADLKALEAVLLHLIRNAKDAMPQGGDVRIETQKVTHTFWDVRPLASALLPGDYVCLSVGDSGAGVSPEDLQQIFDPFFTTKPIGTGIGLGLSMTLGFMQQSGGSVAVRSVVGEGSTFQLYFPMIASDANDLLTMRR